MGIDKAERIVDAIDNYVAAKVLEELERSGLIEGCAGGYDSYHERRALEDVLREAAQSA